MVWDVEASGVNPLTAIPTLMGLESSEDEGFQYTTDIAEFIATLHQHEVWVGWNLNGYDIPLLKRYGLSTRGHIIIDLMEVINGKGFGNDQGRKTIMQTPDGTHLGKILFSKSMDACCEALGGPRKLTGDVDYSWFKQEFVTLSPEIKEKALSYLKRDVEMTSYIYKYVENFFEDFKNGGIDFNGNFKQFLNDEQRYKKLYLTASPAAFTYKALCNIADIEERYQNVEPQAYGGGFVATPSQEKCVGKIYCLDYNSLYPHIMMMANLYGSAGYNYDDEPVWKGTGISDTNGTYFSSEMAPVGEVLKEMYQKRLEYKKNKDERQYTIKIIINTIYGLLGNPAFASVSNFTAAADCTRLGRQWVNAARLHFAEAGYNVLYTDTDSVYVEDTFNNEKKLLSIRDKHIADIQKSVPFPQPTFDMGIDDRIRMMHFFQGADGQLLKKNYLYVTQEGKLTLKGLAIMKSTCTPLSKRVFDKFIKGEILDNNRVKFQRSQIEKWVEEELLSDLGLATVFYKVRAFEDYANPSQIQAQIAKALGEGQYRLVKMKGSHTRGVGRNNNYVWDKYKDEIKLSQIDLTKTFNELKPFIEETQQSLDKFW
jgi:hypothetical protein